MKKTFVFPHAVEAPCCKWFLRLPVVIAELVGHDFCKVHRAISLVTQELSAPAAKQFYKEVTSFFRKP